MVLYAMNEQFKNVFLCHILHMDSSWTFFGVICNTWTVHGHFLVSYAMHGQFVDVFFVTYAMHGQVMNVLWGHMRGIDRSWMSFGVICGTWTVGGRLLVPYMAHGQQLIDVFYLRDWHLTSGDQNACLLILWEDR